MPTFCDVAGIKNYEKKYRNKEKEVDYFDGISFAPTLLGKKNRNNMTSCIGNLTKPTR